MEDDTPQLRIVTHNADNDEIKKLDDGMSDYTLAEGLGRRSPNHEMLASQRSPNQNDMLGAPPRVRRSLSVNDAHRLLLNNPSRLRSISVPNSAHSSSGSEAAFGLRKSKSMPSSPRSPRSPSAHRGHNRQRSYGGEEYRRKQQTRDLFGALRQELHASFRDKCSILQTAIERIKEDRKTIQELREQLESRSHIDPLGSVVSSMTENELPLLPSGDITYHLPMAIITEQSTIVKVNQMFCQLTGYAESFLLQRSLFTLSHRESLGSTGALINDLTQLAASETSHKSCSRCLTWISPHNITKCVYVTGSAISKRQGVNNRVITHFVLVASPEQVSTPQTSDSFSFQQPNSQFPQHTQSQQHSPRPQYVPSPQHSPLPSPQHSPRPQYAPSSQYAPSPQHSPRPQAGPQYGHTSPQHSPRPQYQEQHTQKRQPQQFQFPNERQPDGLDLMADYDALSPHSVMSPSDASVVDVTYYQQQ